MSLKLFLYTIFIPFVSFIRTEVVVDRTLLLHGFESQTGKNPVQLFLTRRQIKAKVLHGDVARNPYTDGRRWVC